MVACHRMPEGILAGSNLLISERLVSNHVFWDDDNMSIATQTELERFNRFVTERLGTGGTDFSLEESLALFREMEQASSTVKEDEDDEHPWCGVLFGDFAKPRVSGPGVAVDFENLPRHELRPNLS